MHFDIILPTINRDSVARAIDSVCRQIHTDWTLWVVQDNCEIETKEWPDNVWVVYCEGPGSDYGAFARNAGFSLSSRIGVSSGQWIAYIDDDDEWLPHHLETLAEMIEQNPFAHMVRTSGQSFKMKHKSPRSSTLVRRLGPINTTDILTVGMAHTREIFHKTNKWLACDNHDHILWREMLMNGATAMESDAVTFHFLR